MSNNFFSNEVFEYSEGVNEKMCFDSFENKDSEIKDFLLQEKSLRYISRELHLDRHYLKIYIVNKGYTVVNNRVFLTKENIEFDINIGLSLLQITKKYKRSKEKIIDYLNENKITHSFNFKKEKLHSEILQENIELLKVLLDEGKIIKEIAKILNVGELATFNFLKKHNLKTKIQTIRQDGITPDTDSVPYEKAKALIEQGITDREICKQLGVGRGQIYYFRQRYGLIKKKVSNYNEQDLTGQTFGKLTVLGYEKTVSRRKYYRCLCICGNETVIGSSKLKSGHTKSCGCAFKDVGKKSAETRIKKCIGKKIGNFTVLTSYLLEGKIGAYGDCQCSCGKIEVKKISKLGKTSSCKACNKESASVRATNNMPYRKKKWYYIKEGNKVSCRSSYEVVYANYLISNNVDFEYEPKCFKLSNGKRYTPDFYLNKSDTYIEIKGWEYNKNQVSKREELRNLGYNLKLMFWKDIVEETNIKIIDPNYIWHYARKMNIQPEIYLADQHYLN